MKSRWIEHKGKKIFHQDFSENGFNSQAVKEELAAVQAIVAKEPPKSMLVISNFRDTEITSDLMPLLIAASQTNKNHVRKTAALGVNGFKRTLGDLISRITGQPLMHFDNETAAKEWLVK